MHHVVRYPRRLRLRARRLDRRLHLPNEASPERAPVSCDGRHTAQPRRSATEGHHAPHYASGCIHCEPMSTRPQGYEVSSFYVWRLLELPLREG